MKPYWQSEDGAIVVYCADYLEALAAGVVPVGAVDLIHDDPSYGNGTEAHRPGRRGAARANTAGTLRRGAEAGKARAWAPLVGNDRPHDPAPLLALGRPMVTWGANHYASRLPDSKAWIVWDKRDDTEPDDGADAELAWSNLGGTLRTFRHAWRGLARASETGVSHLHPTQKPIALSSWIYRRAKLKRGGARVRAAHG